MNAGEISLFVGDEVTDPGERRLISRLRRDLAARGVPATLYANFFPMLRAGQVDLLVRAPRRTTYIEIKTLNPDYPVTGRLNGHWEQQLSDGSHRSLGKNAAKQALAGTWAISDAMGNLARSEKGWRADFKRHIDTVVAIWERIPANSDIETPALVSVVGYADLLNRVTEPGPKIEWDDTEWDAFARQLGLFQPEARSPVDSRSRDEADVITDYRLRSRRSFASEIGPIVDLGADGATGHLKLDDLGRLVADAGVVALVGPSGAGKSVAGLHVAVNHCDAGRLVIRVRADEYEKGRLSNLLARSMAPFSKEPWTYLVQAAPNAGIALTVLVDGLNECPSGNRSELLEQVSAFLHRYPAGLLVTSTETTGLADILGATVLVPTAPSDETRREVLYSHGARNPDRISEQFQSAYELSIAAQCESELEDDSTVADLHAAYVRRFAPSEGLRSGLRALATRLHEKLRSSLPLLEGNAVLHSVAPGLAPSEVDGILSCPLVDAGRQRIRFRHDLLGQFLAAENLVRSAASGADLGRLLRVPANKILASDALAIEADASRVCEVLEYLADPGLLFLGLNGEFGADVAQRLRDRVRHVLNLGIDRTDPGCVTLLAEDWFGRWEPEVRWTPIEQALLAVAGEAALHGSFVDEICDLVDRTDEVCLHTARLLKANGSDSPISIVLANTYSQVRPTNGEGLAASYVVTALELASMTRRYGPGGNAVGLARRFAAVEGPYPWGRLYLASLLVDSRDRQDQAEFAAILRRSWEAGGYHLQLQALQAAEFFAGSDEPYRTDILDVVNGFKASQWGLTNSIIEVLSRFGEIDRGLAAEDLVEEIRDVLAQDGPEACQAAAGFISNQFEDENIVGPHCEAISALSSNERVRLLTMAARGSDITMSMFLDWTLEQLCTLVPTGNPALDERAKATFAAFLDGPPSDSIMPTEATNACVAAIRGWAKFDSALPPATDELNDESRNWRLVAELLLRLERDDVIDDVADIWRQLHQDRVNTIYTLSTLEGAAYRSASEVHRPALHRLYEAYTAELRAVLEWALDHLELVPVHRIRRRGGPDHFVIRALGEVGDLRTAERLRVHTVDPDAGPTAVSAIRRIHQRHQT